MKQENLQSEGKTVAGRSRHHYTQEQVDTIKALYSDIDTKKLASMVGLSCKQINWKAHKLGLKKTPEYKSDLYAKIARIGWRAVENGTSSPHNTKPIGTIRVGTKGYFVIKTAGDRNWVLLHRKIWEDAYGPIPKDKIVAFKDKNKENCTLENLMLASKKEFLLQYSVHNLPKELKELVRLRSTLVRCITIRQRKIKNGKN